MLDPPVAEAQTAAATGTEVFPGNDGQPHEVSWDEKSFMVDGERLNIWSGEIHYWRMPSPEHWRDLFQKIRASGFNAVSLYFFWGFHQTESGGDFDFTGVRDLDLLLDMAAEEGLYVIARPGPYINAEISMGGLPAYMANRGGELRSSDPENLADSLDWIDTFNEIVLEHEVTTGKGSVIMYQVENEMLDEAPRRVEFMHDLVEKVRGDGISVPVFHNDYGMGGRYNPGSGSPGGEVDLDFYAYDNYPLGFNCSAPRNRISDSEQALRNITRTSPHFITEAQGGAFSPWGASFGFDTCAEFTDPAFTRQWGVNNIANGVTAFNYYMSFGGTNWGWTGSPSSGYTSYDYGAAIDENRQLTPKLTVQKELGYFIDAVPQLTAMVPVDAPAITRESGAVVNGYERVATEDLDTSVTGNGTRYLGFRLNNSNDTTETAFTTELALGEVGDVPSSEVWINDDDDAITFTGDWTYSSGENWTSGDHQGDETWSGTAGDTAELTFTGSGIQVIAPSSNNHGYADILIDGEPVGEMNTCLASTGYATEFQTVAFSVEGLDPRVEHTIEVVVRGEEGCPEGNIEPGTNVNIDAFVVTPPRFTVDDSQRDVLEYEGDWESVSGDEQPWAEGNYLDTETFSDEAGDTVSYTFTGTGIQVIAPQSANHGVAQVYIDDEPVERFSTQSGAQNAQKQVVAFETRGLEDGEHTITIEVTGEVGDPGASEPGSFVSIDAFNVLTEADVEEPEEPTGPVFERIPQEPGTFLELHGRDALMMVADLRVGDHDLYYSTSQLVTHQPTADGRLLVLSGVAGDEGETVLGFAEEPSVTTVSGDDLDTTWDADTGTLRLNYTHGEGTYLVSDGGVEEPLLLVLTTRDAVAELWRVSGQRGEGNETVVVSGAHLVRTVAFDGTTAHLTGSMTQSGSITAYVPEGITEVTWNGEPLADATTTPLGAITGGVPGPEPVETPEITEWQVAAEFPEASVDFDDSEWLVADSTSADNPRQGPGPNVGVVLDSNHYHFFEGDVWYRAHYTADEATTLVLNGNGGTGGPGHGRNSASMLVWVNGQYAGAAMAEGQDKTFDIPEGAVTPGEDVVVSVLVRNQGQNLDWSDNGLSKQNRGLWDARLNARGDVTWLIQGARDLDSPLDTARGMYNNGGLYGERAGWHLPGYPDDAWATTTTLEAPEPGVHWYRTSVELDVPEGQDTAFALDVDSELFADGRQDYSRTVMFVNGWNVGTYVGYVGPQTRFTIPSGFLDPNGENEIAIAVTAEAAGMGPQSVELVQVGNMTGGVPHVLNPAPGMPDVPVTAELTRNEVEPGDTLALAGDYELPGLLGDTVTEVVVDWGDGSEPEQVGGSAFAADHRYADAGTYDVRVSVRDAVGGAVLGEQSLVAAVGVEIPEDPTEEPPPGEPEDPTEEPTPGEPEDPAPGEPGAPTEEPTGGPGAEPTSAPGAPLSPEDEAADEGTTPPSSSAGSDGRLPSTGAPVGAAVGLAVLLLTAGALAVTRRNAARS